MERMKLLVKDLVLDCEVAVRKEEQKQGLSGREDLDLNKGMMFLFDKTGRFSIWMRDMHFSLDIMCLNMEYKVCEMACLDKAFQGLYTPNYPVKAIIEMPSGSLKRHAIRIGDQVEFGIY